jgi:hypothetical protein
MRHMSKKKFTDFLTLISQKGWRNICSPLFFLTLAGLTMYLGSTTSMTGGV